MTDQRTDAAIDPVTGSIEAPEVEVSLDIVRRGLIVAPLLIAVCALIWGTNGAWSALYAIALVLINFAISAGMIATTARISLGFMMGAILFGFLVRLGLIMIAVLLVRDAAWISLPALGATMMTTHLGLLAWESRHVALTLGHPGVKPKQTD